MSIEALAALMATLLLAAALIPGKNSLSWKNRLRVWGRLLFLGGRYGEYNDYLRGPVWKELSAKARRRDGFRCRMCNSNWNLQVHHRKYPRFWGTESVADLTTLCQYCHQSISQH